MRTNQKGWEWDSTPVSSHLTGVLLSEKKASLLRLSPTSTPDPLAFTTVRGQWAYHSTSWEVCMKGAQLCPSLSDPMGCNPPGFSVHGILKARILKWVVIPFSRESSPPRNQTRVSHIEGRSFTIQAISALNWLLTFPSVLFC